MLHIGQRPRLLTSTLQSTHIHLWPHGVQACVLLAAKQIAQLLMLRGINSWASAKTYGTSSRSRIVLAISICPMNTNNSSASSGIMKSLSIKYGHKLKKHQQIIININNCLNVVIQNMTHVFFLQEILIYYLSIERPGTDLS